MSKLVAEIIVETLREAGVQRCHGRALAGRGGDVLEMIKENFP